MIRTTALWMTAIGCLGASAWGAERAEPAGLEALWERAPFETSASDLLAVAASLPVPEDSSIEYLDRRTDFFYDASGRLSYSRYVLVRILTADGIDQYSTASLSYSPWHQSQPEIRYRAITSDGEIFPLDPATLTESSIASDTPNIFEDRLRLEAPLPALAVGSIIEGLRTRTDTEPFFPAGSVGSLYLQSSNGPIRRDRTRVRIPSGQDLKWSARLVETEPTVERTPADTTYTFENHDIGKDSAFESGLPREVAAWSWLGFATAESWEPVAQAYGRLVDSQIGQADLPSIELPKERRERIEALLAWTHDSVRYTGLELGAAAIVPVSPKTILERRYGDCKDKATLLTALLRRDGIPAQVALLRAGRRFDIDPELPGLGRMDHAIVYLPEDDLWIDPTDPQAPVGDLPLVDQDRWALVTGHEGRLIKTPASTAEDNRVLVETQVELAPFGKASLVETTTTFGWPQNELRTVLDNYAEDELADLAMAQVEERYLSDAVDGFEFGDSKDFSKPLAYEIGTSEAKRGATDLDTAVYAIRLEPLLDDMPSELLAVPEDAEERENDYYFLMPYTYEWRFDIQAPRGLRHREVPPAETISWGTGSFSKTFSETESGISAVYKLVTGERRVSPEVFEDMRRKVAEIASREADMVWFDHVASADLAAGRTPQAVAALNELVATDPRDALNRTRLARVLAEVGLSVEARRLAEEAVALEPDSAVSAWIHSKTLQLDDIGRLLGPGADVKGAREELDRAAELDQDDVQIAYDRAVMLDYADDGVRYSADAPMDRAVEAYRKFRDDFDRGDLDGNLLFSLLYLKRWDALVSEAEAMEQNPTRDSLLVTGLALTSGVDQALERAELLTTEQGAFVNLIRGTSTQLAAIRRYDEAGRILSRAASGSDNPSVLMNEARFLRLAKPLELGEPPATPEEAAQRWMGHLLQPTLDGEAILDLLHPELASRFRADMDAFEIVMDSTVGSINQVETTFTPQVMTDLVASSWTLKKRSDGAGLHRLDLRGERFGVGFVITLFVRETPEGPRVVGWTESVGYLGRWVTDLIEAGDFQTALELYQFAAEDVAVDEPSDPVDPAMISHLLKADEIDTPEDLRKAAAALMLQQPYTSDAVESLEAALEGSSGRLNVALRSGLMLGHLVNEDWEEASAVAVALEEEHPDSEMGMSFALMALGGAGDFEAVEELARSLVERADFGQRARRTLGDVAVEQGDGDKARKIYLELEAEGEATASDYNQLAWLALFEDSVPEAALDYALQAANADGTASPGVLHTIATVFAALGRPHEAYQVITQAIEAKSRPLAESHDWYCFGLIAEAYGLTEAAIEFYERVEENESPFSTYTLAVRRLAALTKAEAAVAGG